MTCGLGCLVRLRSSSRFGLCRRVRSSEEVPQVEKYRDHQKREKEPKAGTHAKDHGRRITCRVMDSPSSVRSVKSYKIWTVMNLFLASRSAALLLLLCFSASAGQDRGIELLHRMQ